MRISAKTEYACLAMLELAAHYEAAQPVRVKAIADLHNLKPRFLVQILIDLKGAGLVLSLRGASGGYQLARSPEEISLADIITTTDPPSQRSAGAPAARRSLAAQALQSVWHDIHAAEQRILETTSLADLLRRTQQDTLTYQI